MPQNALIANRFKKARRQVKMRRLTSRLKRVGFISVALLSLAFIAMLAMDIAVSYLVRDRIYTRIQDLPARPYAVVLGTSKFYATGQPNLYYKNRLNAAVDVFNHRKADYFLLSGDNTTPYYNEPRTMLRDLKKRGIPLPMLKQDFAGYDTLTSIIRADKTFHLAPFTIISQQFHCERALMIAKLHHIDAICFAAAYPEGEYRVRIRDIFARSAMFLDFLFKRQPKTLEIVKEKTLKNQ